MDFVIEKWDPILLKFDLFTFVNQQDRYFMAEQYLVGAASGNKIFKMVHKEVIDLYLKMNGKLGQPKLDIFGNDCLSSSPFAVFYVAGPIKGTQLLFNYLEDHDLNVLFLPEGITYAGERMCTGPQDDRDCYGPIEIGGEKKFINFKGAHMTGGFIGNSWVSLETAIFPKGLPDFLKFY